MSAHKPRWPLPLDRGSIPPAQKTGPPDPLDQGGHCRSRTDCMSPLTCSLHHEQPGHSESSLYGTKGRTPAYASGTKAIVVSSSKGLNNSHQPTKGQKPKGSKISDSVLSPRYSQPTPVVP
jgi:hypothetical protein